MVRKINISNGTIGDWCAIVELMATQMVKGRFEPTLVVMRWDNDRPTIDLGVHEDADMLDVATAREEGFVVGRRYAFGGGTAVHTPNLPSILLFYEKSNSSILNEIDMSGEANVVGLEKTGLDAEYDSIGDTEIVQDGTNFKVIAGAASNYRLPELWAVTSSVVWEFPEQAAILDDVVSVPPEKFEDKDTDSLTSRMKSLSSIVTESNMAISKDDVLDAIAKANVKRILDENEGIVEETWTEMEQEFINNMKPFFESDTWINRVSTSYRCRQVSRDLRVGNAAHKSEKLINTSLILEPDATIRDAIISGDFYIRPHPSVTSDASVRQLEDAVRGVDASNKIQLEEALDEVMSGSNFEMPGIPVSDIVAPLMRAAENTTPVNDYLEHWG